MSPRDLLLNPSIYPEPEKFKPERWLRQTASGGNDEKGIDLDKFFVPFGKGGRACQGMKYVFISRLPLLSTTKLSYQSLLSSSPSTSFSFLSHLRPLPPSIPKHHYHATTTSTI